MARILRVSPRYLSDAKTLVPAGSRASRDVSRVLRALENSNELPERGDVSTLLSLGGSHVQLFAHGRRVTDSDLWVWYRATNGEVSLEALTKGL